MKLLFTSLLILVTITCFAQPIEFKGIIKVDSSKGTVTKDELFDRASQWVAMNYNSANNVTQYSDKSAGTLIVKAVFDYLQFGVLAEQTHYVNYTLKLSFKDNRVKYEVVDFYDKQMYGEVTMQVPVPSRVNTKGAKKYHQKHWSGMQLKCLEYGDMIVAQLKSSLEIPSQKNDW